MWYFTPVRRVRVLVSGTVQGVFFRSALRDVARRLDLTGWAHNLPDGRVEAELQGEPRAVEHAVAFCGHGPPAATVAAVDVADIAVVAGEQGFSVA